MDFSKFLSALKVAPHILFGVGVATGLALFSPDWFKRALGIGPLVESYRLWLGGAFLLSTSLFISSSLARFTTFVWPTLLDRWNVRQRRSELRVLSPPERKVLSEYLREDTTTLPQYISDGVVAGLVGKGILYMASNVGHRGSTAFDYNVQPWAWRELKKHPELVDGHD